MLLVCWVEVGGVFSGLSANALSSLILEGVGEIGTGLSSRASTKTSMSSSSMVLICLKMDA